MREVEENHLATGAGITLIGIFIYRTNVLLKSKEFV